MAKPTSNGSEKNADAGDASRLLKLRTLNTYLAMKETINYQPKPLHTLYNLESLVVHYHPFYLLIPKIDNHAF
jgi:hypothetical protein